MESRTASACVLAGILLAAAMFGFSTAMRGTERSVSVELMGNGSTWANVQVGWLEPQNDWNPLNVELSADRVFCYLMYSTLFTYDEDLNQSLPSLALDYYQVVETDLSLSTYVNISSNAFFRNNADPSSTSHPLTAEDVRFTFQLIMDHPGGSWDGNIATISSVSVTDTYQAHIVTPSYDSTLIERLAWVPIVPKYIWEFVQTSQLLTNKAPGWLVGSGPFVYNSSSLDVYYTFDRAPNYHASTDFGDERTVKIDSVTFWQYIDETALATSLKQGDIDCACMVSGVDDYLNLSVGATVPITGYRVVQLGVYDAAINAIPMDFRTANYGKGNPILLDPVVRKAILMTMDKESVVNETMQGLGAIADSVLASDYWHKSIEGQLPYDVVAAHYLLTSNGYNDTNADGTLECGPTSLPVMEGWVSEGAALSLRLQAPDSDPFYGAIGAAWAQMAEGSGIKLNFELESEAIMINNAWYKADYDLWVWAWSWGPEPIASLKTWTTEELGTGGNNCQMPMGPWWYGPSNQSLSPTGTPYSAFDENVSKAVAAQDPVEKKHVIDTLQQWIYDSYTETPPSYLIDLFGVTEERYTGWGNWTLHPGRAILSELLWTWFDLVPVPNEAPVASFTFLPLSGDTTTVFQFNASSCTDAEDPVDSLSVRWDWENDSLWDTSFTTDKVATHQFAASGTYTVVLEVTDSDGATDTARADVTVVEIPEFGSLVLPVTALLGIIVTAIVRRRH